MLWKAVSLVNSNFNKKSLINFLKIHPVNSHSICGQNLSATTTFRYSKSEVFKKPEKRVTKTPEKSDMGGLRSKEHP